MSPPTPQIVGSWLRLIYSSLFCSSGCMNADVTDCRAYEYDYMHNAYRFTINIWLCSANVALKMIQNNWTIERDAISSCFLALRLHCVPSEKHGSRPDPWNCFTESDLRMLNSHYKTNAVSLSIPPPLFESNSTMSMSKGFFFFFFFFLRNSQQSGESLNGVSSGCSHLSDGENN